MYLHNNNINLLIDFDSTFVVVETLDIISKLSVPNNQNKIIKITDRAMKGEIEFSSALNQRVKMLHANKNHINQAIKILENKVSDSFIANKKKIKQNSSNIFIVSGGFKEIIYPIVKKYNIKYENIYANNFLYNEKNDIIGVDKKNILSKNQGKVEIAKTILGKNIIIGDGYTDYEVKQYNGADIFIQFIENINRETLNSKADLIAKNFDEIISFINNL